MTISLSARCMRNIDLAFEVVLVWMIAANAAGQEASGRVGSNDPPPAYAGSEACGTCHEDLATAFARNPHEAVEAEEKRGWQGKACESCHGPGQKHNGALSA